MLRAKNINPLVSVPSSLRENIREDLYVLQASQSSYLFNTAVKWSTKNKAIVKSRLPTVVYLLVVIQWLHSKMFLPTLDEKLFLSSCYLFSGQSQISSVFRYSPDDSNRSN